MEETGFCWNCGRVIKNGEFCSIKCAEQYKRKQERQIKIGKKTRPLVWTLCINVSKKVGYILLADKILSFYLSIKENEDEFIETANFRYVNTQDEFQEGNESV